MSIPKVSLVVLLVQGQGWAANNRRIVLSFLNECSTSNANFACL